MPSDATGETKINKNLQIFALIANGIATTGLIGLEQIKLLPLTTPLEITPMDEPPPADPLEGSYTRATLIERVKQRYDEHAWREFAEIYKGYLYSVIRNLRMSEHDTQEVHQKVMVKLWEKLPELDTSQIRRFRSYLAGVAKNEVKQFIRSRERRLTREQHSLEANESDYLNSIRLPEIERIAEEEWKVHLTNLAFRKIEGDFSKKAIEVFRLSIEGLDADTISKRVGIGRPSVATLKARVKARFFMEIERLKQELD